MKCNTILKPVTRMVFQCTWRTCGHECDVREQMEEHVRIKHLGITSCTDDHEEDFYYTEVELDSPIDSSGVSSAGQSPMHEPSNNKNSLSIANTTSITTPHNTSSSPTPVVKQAARKRGPRAKHLIESSADHFTNSRLNSSIATWMHMDMAKPPHEDPEYLSKLNKSNNLISNSIENKTTVIKRERKRAVSNNQYGSDQSDFESTLNQQQQYLQNLTADQLIKLQQQNNLHLKNNIQHLQQLHRQHQHLHQLHQLHQYNQYNQQVKRKYTKSQQSNSGSILMQTTRTKSVICSMAQLENDFDHHLLTSSLSPNPLKRSKPIKIPGISLAHRDAVYQPANQSSPSFTVGSVQSSPTGYFHCFSPTPPHSLSSPTSSNSSMYSLGSCNSPGSSSIASSSSSYSPNGVQSSLNRSSAHYSPIDTLLQTVENERLQQQLAMEDESLQSSSSINSNNSNGGKKLPKLKSANVSDLDLVAQNEEDEDIFDHHQTPQQKQIKMNLKRIEDKNELVNQTLETIKCTNNSQLIMSNSINKKTLSSVIRSGHDALLAKGLTVDCDIDHQNKLNSTNNSSLIDLQTKQQQLVQTAQQALVTLASTATNLCNRSIQSQSATSNNGKTTSQINEKTNSIRNNSTNSSQIIQTNKNNRNDENVVNQQQANGLLMAANLVQSAEQSQQQTTNQQPFNYLVSHSGRTIKPTAAAKSYVQRKHRITKYMRTQNLSNSSSGKQSGINKSKNNNKNNLLQFERLIEAAQLNNNQNENSSTADLNMVRNSIISSVSSLNDNSANNQISNEIQQSQVFLPVQRTPTGRIRNSGAKCRKKYGMENKHQWCVQCRWKKACSRVESNGGLNLTQYNNNQAGNNRGRPGRPANSSNNSDQRRAVVQATSSTSTAEYHHPHNASNVTGDFSAMAEELLRTGTLLNNQRTVVSAK